MSEREWFSTRIRQLRGRIAPVEPAPPPRAGSVTHDSRIDDLAERVAHLEQMVEGLQDSVHRESVRQAKLIAEIQARVEPGPMGAALDRDARERGL